MNWHKQMCPLVLVCATSLLLDTDMLKISLCQEKRKREERKKIKEWVTLSSWVGDLQRELASRFWQLCGELDEVNASTVHCTLHCAAALSRTFNQHRFGPRGWSSVRLVILLLCFQRGLAVNQHPGQEQHTQCSHDGMLGKGHVQPESLLLHKHTVGKVSSNISSAVPCFLETPPR